MSLYFIFKSNLRSKLNAQDGKKKVPFSLLLFSPIFFVTWLTISWEKSSVRPCFPLKSMSPAGVLLSARTLAVGSHSWRRQLINFTTVISFHNGIILCHHNVQKARSFSLRHTVSDLPFQIYEPVSWDPVTHVKWILHFANFPHAFPLQPNSFKNNNKEILKGQTLGNRFASLILQDTEYIHTAINLGNYSSTVLRSSYKFLINFVPPFSF